MDPWEMGISDYFASGLSDHLSKFQRAEDNRE
jgi:hypothetical protein